MAELASELHVNSEMNEDSSTSELQSFPPTPSKSPPPKFRVVGNDDSSTKIILEKLSSIEKSSQDTAKAMNALTVTVQSLLSQVTAHNEHFQSIDEEMATLKLENRDLKKKVNDLQRYSRLWNLKLHGVREEKGEDVRRITMDILCNVAPRISDKMPFAVDIVHRLGEPRQDGSPRTIIIRFSMRFYRDIIWKEAKNNGFLQANNLRFKEALTADDIAARQKLWPLVKKSRAEGKKASFSGPYAFIEGKKIDGSQG